MSQIAYKWRQPHKLRLFSYASGWCSGYLNIHFDKHKFRSKLLAHKIKGANFWDTLYCTSSLDKYLDEINSNEYKSGLLVYIYAMLIKISGAY